MLLVGSFSPCLYATISEQGVVRMHLSTQAAKTLELRQTSNPDYFEDLP